MNPFFFSHFNIDPIPDLKNRGGNSRTFPRIKANALSYNLEIPKFKQGSVLRIKLATNGNYEQNLTGTCLKKTNQGLFPPFTLKYTSSSTNEPIIQTFALFSPFLRQISVLPGHCRSGSTRPRS